jgi:hypothetical protein
MRRRGVTKSFVRSGGKHAERAERRWTQYPILLADPGVTPETGRVDQLSPTRRRISSQWQTVRYLSRVKLICQLWVIRSTNDPNRRTR